MSLGVRAGLVMLLLAGCAEAGPVPGWQLATDFKPSPVPYQVPVANVAVALEDSTWRFNGARISESKFLALAKASVDLSPRPGLLVDFSSVSEPAEKRRMMIAIASAAECSADFPCLEGTKAEYYPR
ncbi:MAG: hypothetical protein ACK4GG_06250 [Sphingomonas sp.]